jgi:uncharacterized membrane protein
VQNPREQAQIKREGQFQRWLALIAGASGAMSGLEVAYEHYKGSYSEPVMYTPIVLSAALLPAGVAAFFSRRAARSVLPLVSGLTLLDSGIGFIFHVRGVARKPGGWSLPVTNVVMGPPLFAPLLFGVSAYIGVVASTLERPEHDEGLGLPLPAHSGHWAAAVGGKHEPIDEQQDRRETRYRRHLAVATAIAASLSGLEAAYSHYKNNFRFAVQWTPLVASAALVATACCAVGSKRAAQTWLPAISAIALVDGAIGFGYHARGVLRRPGGLKKPFYNIIYGPPILAPLLFSASGFLGILASLLGNEA